MAARLAALFTALTAFASLVSVSADGLSLKVTGPAQVDDISDLHIKTTLTNTGTSALTLLNNPGSALSTSPTDIFTISHESGAHPHFRGKLINYNFDLALKNGAVTTISPGQSIDVTHSLADAYNFTNSGRGTYEISPSTLFQAVSEAGTPQAISATLENSHTVDISGSGRLAVPREAGPQMRETPLMKGQATFQRCNDTQQVMILDSFGTTRAYIKSAVDYLALGKVTSRYTTWFGKHSDTRWKRVKDIFTRLDAVNFHGFTYHCDELEGECHNSNAWVYPDEYAIVHLCTPFFTFPVSGTDDSRGATLLHEATHFRTVGRTNDRVYGQENCRSLAQRDPDAAIKVADCYEFFAVNPTALP